MCSTDLAQGVAQFAWEQFALESFSCVLGYRELL